MVLTERVHIPELLEVTATGTLRPHFHYGQWRAWQSLKRFVVVLAGTQGGKTSFGPIWLWREIQRRGPGDYLVVTPTYPLLEMKALPEFLRLFAELLDLGRFYSSGREFVFSEAGCWATFGEAYDPERDPPTRVIFGYAANPESLESATAKAAWLDEAGQKRFKLASWEAILRRLSLAMGRVLITTTPYDLGWLKQKLWDPWQRLRGQHPEIDVVRFESIMNPAFPREEFERARRDLPAWKFKLFYQAVFTRPAGLIYDSFIDLYFPQGHKLKGFRPDDVPLHWPRYLGLDFGGVNTAGAFYAAEPGTSNLYLYREYKAGGRTARVHARHLLAGEPFVTQAVGGAGSETQWRSEFAEGGLEVLRPPIDSVEVGIDRVYGCHARGEILVSDLCTEYLAEKESYSRKLDDLNEPTEEIAEKSRFHLMDAERYIISHLRQPQDDVPRSHSFGRAA